MNWLCMGYRSCEYGENFHPHDKPCDEQTSLLQMVASNLDHPTPSGLPHIPMAVPTDTLQIHPANPAHDAHHPAYI